MFNFRGTYVFQPVQVLVALSACLAAKRLLLFHTQGSWIRRTCFGVDNRESAVTVFMQLLSLMTMRLVVPRAVLVDFFHHSYRFRGKIYDILKSILVLVGLFTADDGALERLVFFRHHHAL